MDLTATLPDLPQRFRRVYFHLYSNSNVSRAEALLADLSLLLLFKLLAETSADATVLTDFLNARGGANTILLPPLRAAYPRLVGAGDRFRLNDEAMRHALAELEDIRLSESAAHVLGEAFQALIGPRIRGDKGQFFTPRSLVRAMVEIVAPKDGESILDPACGTGGFLYEALAHLQSAGGAPARLDGADKDRDLARFAAALLAYRSEVSNVVNINSLSDDEWRAATLDREYDVILTNPPFGAKISIRDKELLRGYTLAHEWRQQDNAWEPTRHISSSQDPQVLFLEFCIRHLRPGGRLGIVLPEGVFGNKKQVYIWDFVRSQGRIMALLDCPRTTFQPGTDTKTNVLFFQKEALKRRGRTVPVAVALACGHDRRGRTRRADGSAYPDDFAKIGTSFHRKTNAQNGEAQWRKVEISNPYYLVPRYYIDEPPTSPSEASILRDAKWATLGCLKADGLIKIWKGHEVGSEAYGTGEIPFVRTSDISNFEVSSDPTKSVSEDIYEGYAPQQRLKPGSILMVVDGRYRIGTTAILTARSCRCVVQSHIRIIDVADSDTLDPYGLLFALNLPSIRRRIRNLVFIQSTLGTLGSRLFELKVPLLAGPGAWTATIETFRESIEQRDQLLGKLTDIVGPEIEL